MKNFEIEGIKTLIFDLDGVITSEIKYWNTARLTVWELICSSTYLGISQYFGDSQNLSTRLNEIGDRVIPSSFIHELKSRAVNSNWDLTFFVFCLHFVSILSESNLLERKLGQELIKNKDLPIQNQLQKIGKSLQKYGYEDQISHGVIKQFWQETSSLRGTEVLNYINFFVDNKLGRNFDYFDPKGELWQLCYENFQLWYEGKKGYNLPDDETVLDLNSIDAVLKILYNSGRYTLAIATGRPRNEVIEPLTSFGIIQYFDSKRIVTYDEVLEAESIIAPSDQNLKLGKPHPFVLFKAIFPHEEIQKLCAEGLQLENGNEIAYVGDGGSDVLAAKRAGCLSIGVLTGFVQEHERENKQKMLTGLGCDVVLDSILELPQLLGVPKT